MHLADILDILAARFQKVGKFHSGYFFISRGFAFRGDLEQLVIIFHVLSDFAYFSIL